MFKLVIACCLLGAALAAPQGPLQPRLTTREPVPIVAQSSLLNEDGSFQNSYESGDGTKVDAAGVQKAVGPKGEAGTAIQGSYSFYIDNVLYTLTYTADENGFQPQGNYLPTPPPIPEKILEALAYNAAHPEEDNLKRK
ncbi:endocuticle structural glycoprotein SgAbd-3-like [Bacillus rossius redtenbacheri]|uniref:endocuticle structural glycoprotein SgAbd-3-like n=1 Tax=Bacillus rossius redtenbacheri TaxID=93214 RepID=UPI002FDE8E49